MSEKVISIAAGEAHTLALTDDGAVFSWGRGTFGRLGTGNEEDELAPVPIADVSGQKARVKFVAVAAGAYHSLALQDDGSSVWSWGYNIYNQLGHGEQNTSVPALVKLFQESSPEGSDQNLDKKPLKIHAINAGGMMSVAIDSQGSLWVWGNSPQPKETNDEGLFSLEPTSPLLIRDFLGQQVVNIACGTEHIVAAVRTGGKNLICYSWGNNNHGQLGLGDKKSRSNPEIIPAFSKDKPWSVHEISCGAYHSAVLLTHEEQLGCHTFGLNDNGQLGHGTTVSSLIPVPVLGFPPDTNLVSVDCGLFHTSAVADTGEVWSWGMEKGLGLCPDACFTSNDAGDALSPLKIEGKFFNPVQIACGAAHTVLVADGGSKLWAWGRGRNGLLGNGQEKDNFAPVPVMWPPLVQEEQKSAESEELRMLKEKMVIMERYTTMLHVSIFRKPFNYGNVAKLFQENDTVDIWKELEHTMDLVDNEELVRMEMFYRSMRAMVKEKLMGRRVQEMVKESLLSMSKGSQPF